MGPSNYQAYPTLGLFKCKRRRDKADGQLQWLGPTTIIKSKITDNKTKRLVAQRRGWQPADFVAGSEGDKGVAWTSAK